MNLASLSIIGFTTGQSLCAHCGTGIKNLVLVRDADGVTHHIGTDCAMRVGLDARQVKDRITDATRADNERKSAERAEKDAERMQVYRAKLEKRRADVAHISDALRAIGGEFYTSLADRIECGSLSGKQSWYVAEAVTGRRTKKNADQFDAIRWTCEDSEI
jgi:transcription initiation factor TFIIIB Brf1 subunit/transcription initiation factor TFIIB